MTDDGGASDRRLRVAPHRRRAAAVGLDYLVISAYVAALIAAGVLIRSLAPAWAGNLFGHPLTGEATAFVVLTVPVTLYFALAEASVSRATWGKRRMGLAVVATDGARLSRGRSLLRSGTKFLPWELAHAGIWHIQFPEASAQWLPIALLTASWVLVGVNVTVALLGREHRALHDLVAGTRVVRP